MVCDQTFPCRSSSLSLTPISPTASAKLVPAAQDHLEVVAGSFVHCPQPNQPHSEQVFGHSLRGARGRQRLLTLRLLVTEKIPGTFWTSRAAVVLSASL
jgi:hypothetical protein